MTWQCLWWQLLEDFNHAMQLYLTEKYINLVVANSVFLQASVNLLQERQMAAIYL